MRCVVVERVDGDRILPPLTGALTPAQFVDAYVKLKMREEWNPYAGHLSSWEMEQTMDV
jgi:glutamine synthetase